MERCKDPALAELFRSADALLGRYGPCSIPLKGVTLHVGPMQRGEICVSIVGTEKPVRAELRLSRVRWTITPESGREILRKSFGSEERAVAKVAAALAAALHNRERIGMPRSALEPPMEPEAGTIEAERLALARELHELLLERDGELLERRPFASATRLFDIRRSASDPFTFVVEAVPLVGRHERLSEPAVTVAVDAISYSGPDGATGAALTGSKGEISEGEAAAILRQWLRELRLSQASEQGDPGPVGPRPPRRR